MASSSGSFASQVTGDYDKLVQYLEITEACMQRVQRMASPSASTSPKLNSEQCKYLIHKLEVAMESAHSFSVLLKGGHFCISPLQAEANHLEIYKLLHALARDVEDFIQQCCKDEWIQAALMVTNVSELLAFDLELCALVFSGTKSNNSGRWSCTRTEADGIFKAEAKIVKEKASVDRETLLTNVNALLQTREPTNSEYQLASLLLEMLERPRPILVGDTPESSQSNVFETVARSLNQMEILGKSDSATVYRATWLGVDVAKKTFYGPFCLEFEKEVSVFEGLSHPNITSLLCYDKDMAESGEWGECSIVMELMDEDLFNLIQKRLRGNKTRGMIQKILRGNKTRGFPFVILEAVDIMFQIAGGVRYLHEKKIVHRDLKSANIFVRSVKESELGNEYRVQAKVSDFGLSRTKEKSMTYSNQTLHMGTTRWMAPEMIKSWDAESRGEMSDGGARVMKYPFKCDVYSFAMVCYEILTGKVPFSSISNPHEIKRMVLDCKRPELPDHCPEVLKSLIERCWSQDASRRPHFDDICAELAQLKCLLLMTCVPDIFLTLVKYDKGKEIANVIPSGSKGRTLSPVNWLVGLDFGNTYSGFAYSSVGELDKTYVNYDWPKNVNLKADCKTLSAIYYKSVGPDTFHCASWGHGAQSDFLADRKNMRNGSEGFYVSNFMRFLIPDMNCFPSEASLPHPLTATTIVTDYLMHMGALVLREMRCHFDVEGRTDSIQWCVTVPSTWEENVKQQMKACMVNAGLVSGEGATESVKFVLKFEAASFHCYPDLNPRDVFLYVKDKILVADVGSGTVDIMVLEVIGIGQDVKVQEFTESSGSLKGGSFVDECFMRFLSGKIGCLNRFLRLHSDGPFLREQLLQHWEDIKCRFGHEMFRSDTLDISIPAKLAAKWKAYDEEHGYFPRGSYDVVELRERDVKSIFEPVVDDILGLIDAQLIKVQGIKVMFVVGGFAGSPYLMERIHTRFCGEVDHIYSPPNPRSSIMEGAILKAAAVLKAGAT